MSTYSTYIPSGFLVQTASYAITASYALNGGTAGGGGSTSSVAGVVVVTGVSQSMVSGVSYLANNTSSQINFTLPTSSAVGAYYEVVGMGSGGWKIQQSASQVIYFGIATTTTGRSGSLESSHYRDSIGLRSIIADTTFQVISAVGEITVN